MSRTEDTLGIAVLCDSRGTVVEVLRDAFGDEPRISPGQVWTAMVDRGSLKKALTFMLEVQEEGAAFDWEMNVPHHDTIVTLHFVGVAFGDSLLVVGAESSNGVLELYEEMMRISNEQANALRRAVKEVEGKKPAAERPRGDLFDEISRLNNELVAMQRELARKNAELSRLNEQKNELLGMAAHDLRNPLHAILSYSDFLIEDLSDTWSDDHLEFVSIIQSSSEFMAGLVNDLLDVAKIESGKLQLSQEPTDLRDLVERVVGVMRPLAGNKGIALKMSVQRLPTVRLDRGKIEQVLNNLLSNAIKYSLPDTTVDVRLRHEDSRAVLEVEDRGQGIPEEEQDALFQPFKTTSVRGTAGERSTGLGLVITKRIVEGHGGRIEVDSEVGVGSTFTVSLPMDREMEA